jgi:uracil-DNA glycosylase
VDILRPELVIAVGTLAIEQVLGEKGPLVELVAKTRRVRWHGREVDVVALPHPSGASPWHKMEPGKTLLGNALKRLARHPAMREWTEK